MSDAPAGKEVLGRKVASSLFIIGSGGMTLQMLDTLDALAAGGREIVVADDRDLPPLGRHQALSIAAVPAEAAAVIAIADPATRRRIADRRPDLSWTDLRAATTLVSADATIGSGAMLGHGVIVEAFVRIGRHFHANLHSYVAHESVIGDFVTLAPRVSCNGNVTIEDGVYIGTGAMIRQGRPGAPLQIGEGAFIGMGAIVTRDVPAGARLRAGAIY